MMAFDKRTTEFILNLLRSREGASRTNCGAEASGPLRPAKIRQVQLSDYDAVVQLKARWELIPESYENWERFWINNPALRDSPGDRPMGWGLEAEGQLVGYLGNISSTHFYG